MKFTVVEISGREKLLRHLDSQPIRRITCPKCKGTGEIDGAECPTCKGWKRITIDKRDKKESTLGESTLSGTGYPTATANGQQAVDKMPLGTKLAKRKRKVKRIMARRVQPKL